MFQTANGIGRAALSCYHALRAEGFDPLAVDLSALFNQIDMTSQVSLTEMPSHDNGTLILFANAPETERALLGLGLRRWHRWRIIGAWAWELTAPPDDWVRQTRFLSEIWAPSQFVQKAFQQRFSLPVQNVPHYLPAHRHATAWPSPARRGDKVLRFLTIGDGHSSFHRKNLLATMKMFMKAFPDDEPVHLTVKCRNLSFYRQYEAEVMSLASADNRVSVIDRTFSEEEQTHLLWNSDILVSSHRSEGFGIHLAEAMAAGRTTVATGWSGNLEFMTKRNSVLLPYVLTPVNDPSGIYRSLPNAHWADVDIDAGVRSLRDLFASPRRRNELASNAQRDIPISLRSRPYAVALDFPAERD